MPAAIPALVGTGASILVGGGITGAIVGAVAAGVASKFLGLNDLPDFDDRARGIEQNITNPTQPLPVVYGSTRFAGSRVAAFVTDGGEPNEYFHQITAFCEGEINQFSQVYFDDIPQNNSRFSGLVDFGDGINAHKGTAPQTADSQAVSRIPDWSSTHRGDGIAYIYSRLTYDPEALPRVPVVTADVQGKRIVNVLTFVTEFNNNPASVIFDYLTNTVYGCAIASTDIDITSFQVAANICDQSVTVAPAPTQARYTCDGVVNIDRKQIDVLNELLTCCRGLLVWSGGKYKLIIQQNETATFDIDESNLVGSINIKFAGSAERHNRIRARYFNENRKHQEDIHISDDTSARAADNAEVLEKQVQFPYTTNEFRVRRLADIELYQSRSTIIAECSVTIAGFKAEVGDVINLSYEPAGWVTKKFRVLQIAFDSEENYRLVLQEHNSTDFTEQTPDAQIGPPSYIFPPLNDISNNIDVTVDPDTSYLQSFESGDTAGWVNQDGTIANTADACVGNNAAVVTHGGSGNLASASHVVPVSFAANVLAASNYQIRCQFWAKQPSSNAAAGLKMRLVGDTQVSGWFTFVTSGTCQNFGFIWKPTLPQTTLSIEIQGDSNDAGTGASIVDNILLYVLPDFIDATNIGTWLGVAAIGELYVANAAITEAKIADLAVTNAKINDLAVSTLKIQDNAVTVPVGSYASGFATLSGSYITLRSVTFDAQGGDALLMASCRLEYTGAANGRRTCTGRIVNATGGMQIRMGGGNVDEPTEVPCAFIGYRNNTSGNVTYSFQFLGGGDVRTDRRGLIGIGGRK